jgi:hypothetical protein
MLENVKRKSKLAEKIENSTEKFKEEACDLREELSRVKERLIQVFNHKETVEDQAQFLLNDRGKVGSAQKYYASISEFLRLAKGLKQNFDQI